MPLQTVSAHPSAQIPHESILEGRRGLWSLVIILWSILWSSISNCFDISRLHPQGKGGPEWTFCGLWIILLNYEHNLNHNVFWCISKNLRFCQNLLFLTKSERSERDTRTDGGRRRTHTLFKVEAHLHKKPFGAKNWSAKLLRHFFAPIQECSHGAEDENHRILDKSC